MKNIFILFILSFSILVADNFNQTVSYKIDVQLIPGSKSLKVKSLMFYQNNSPDELKEIYVHIYWNLYSAKSYARKLARAQKDYFSQITKDVEIKKVLLIQNGQEKANDYELDNTVMRIPLISPLKTGESLKLEIELDEEVPPEGLRMGYYKRNFSIAHWFPSVCVYDKFGWHKDQYLGTGEFFEELSDFEVNLTLPKTYLVFSTGVVQNQNEVYTEEILTRLSEAKNSSQPVRIFNPPDQIKVNDKELLTWNLKAENVRTFAFAAFEDYIWDAASTGNVLVHTVYPKSIENFYKEEGMKAALHAIKFYSEKIGPYVYPQMFVTVGGSSGGMEYPGIVFMGRGLVGGIMSKNTASVIIHEIGHNWFPMMLNSNEVEFAFQDEGFNTFFTNLAMEELYGRENNRFTIDGWLQKFIPNSDIRTEDYAEVISYQLTGYDEPILTHSDRYEQTFAYFPNSYSKTSMVLFMLQYVMGENAFAELWKEYYTRFLFKKIYPEDFFNLADEIYQKYNGRKSLRWFFDQWFNKNYKLDLALAKCEYEKKDGKYLTNIVVANKERAVMPCDVVIYLENGNKTTLWFDVDDFTKGSKYVSKTLTLDYKPIKAEINPDKRLLDVNRLNNTSGFLPEIYVGLKPLVELNQFPFHYKVFWYPTIWFNDIDKFKVGLGLQGKYLQDQKFFDINISTGIKLSKSSLAGELTLGDRLKFLDPLAYGSIKFFNLEGRRGAKIKIDKEFEKYYNRNPKFIVSVSANYFDAFDERYFDPVKFVSQSRRVTTQGYGAKEYIDEYVDKKFLFLNINLTYQNNWEFFRTKFNVNYQSGVVRRLEKQTINYYYWYWSEYSESKRNIQYQKFSFSFLQDFRPKNFLSFIKLRQFIGVTPNKLPKPTEFYLATVNPIEEFDLPLYRTYGIIGRNFRQNHSIPNGGGFMRGYFNNNLSDDLITVLNAQINFGKTFSYLGTIGKFIGFLNPSFFFDFGNVWANEKEFNFNAFKYDWGFSFSLLPEFDSQMEQAVNQINPFGNLGIQDIRFDLPLYVSHPPAGENKFKFRWLIAFRSEL